MDHNQIQEIGKQEINQPLSDDNEMRVKKRNEVSAIASFVLGFIAIIIDPFFVFYGGLFVGLIVWFFALILGLGENQVFNTILDITFYGINAICCILNILFSILGIGLVWRGFRSQYWYIALFGLLFNLFALAVMALFLYQARTGQLF